VAAQFRGLARAWRVTTGLGDGDVAGAIRQDEIDVLVILAGHTGHNRMGVAAHRPAPVQVSFHDLTTSGLAVMDAWLTDPVLHPAASEEQFTERLVRLPCFYLHRPPDAAPEIGAPPHRTRGHITFGSCNNPAKLSLPVIRLWSRILQAVPNSRLLLKYVDWFGDEAVAGRFGRLFETHGIAADRIRFERGDLRRAEQLRILNEVDIALDPFPFNGSTTTFEALWMGVPVVTLAGSRFVGRVGASVLTRLDLANLVAETAEDYVRIAVALAADAERLGSLRRSLREQVRASALCNAPAYARSVEAAYRALWTDWCRGRQAAS
jgi:predicted O-linked N-acetylglucosamine transferase (SPINDLY family)